MQQGIPFGIGLVIGFALAIGLVLLGVRHPRFSLGSAGSAMGACLLLTVCMGMTRMLDGIIRMFSPHANPIIGLGLATATGLALAMGSGPFLPLGIPWVTASIKVVGWLTTSVSAGSLAFVLVSPCLGDDGDLSMAVDAFPLERLDEFAKMHPELDVNRARFYAGPTTGWLPPRVQ